MAEEKVTDEEKKTKDLISRTRRTWNAFVGDIIKAKADWEAFQEIIRDNPRLIDQLPVDLQRVLARYKREAFYIMVPDFVAYTSSYRTLDDMIIQEEKEKE